MAKPKNVGKSAKSTKRANLVASSSVALLAEHDLPELESSEAIFSVENIIDFWGRSYQG